MININFLKSELWIIQIITKFINIPSILDNQKQKDGRRVRSDRRTDLKSLTLQNKQLKILGGL